ncbi:hypothetical protein [Legionella clemsonensis]|uniref:Uncharacterized protein n=1 Tax=Legionella clemsonensis TaxID=1867846 RepID=A0A222P2X1_9GAMM|nr:hypothetical protein [Legionella clemsonensis]ASQ46186.1 hypothetical protein clem_08170 [Legionella clemsonensis]
MRYRLFLSIAAAGVWGSTAFAGTMGWSVIPSKDWTWVGSIAAEPVWARGGEAQTFFLTPEIEKTYAARKSTNVLASGELFLCIQKIMVIPRVGSTGIGSCYYWQCQTSGL